MVQIEQERFWEIKYYPYGNHPPKEFLKENATVTERGSILAAYKVLERVKYPRDFPNTKYYRHDRIPLYQLTVGDFRMYLHLDSKKKYLVVCYACRKVSNEAKPQDKDRAVSAIRGYIQDFE